MRTALCVIATGDRYQKFIEPLLHSARKHFVEHEVVLFVDRPAKGCPYRAEHVIYKSALGFPDETLRRYRTLIGQEKRALAMYDYVFYCDIDMLFVNTVGPEIFASGITATLHPGYVGTPGTPERRSESQAWIPKGSKNWYFAGGFVGGSRASFWHMAHEIEAKTYVDLNNGITAVWHDESHLNRYLYDNPPAKILTPEYCYPENAGEHYKAKWREWGIENMTPRLVCLEKKNYE